MFASPLRSTPDTSPDRRWQAGDAEQRCFAVCADLAAGRLPRTVPSEDGRMLRHLLRSHGLSGLAARATASERLNVAQPVRQAIERDWADAQRWATLLDEETARIGRAALGGASEGLSPPILLKGAAVARRYSDPSLRPYTDIDLLVPADELERWARLLGRIGFRGPAPEIRAARRREQEGISLLLEIRTVGVSCDLHACLFIERRARDLTYEVLALQSEDSVHIGLLEPSVSAQLIVLALHLAHHPSCTWRMIWLRDFVELAAEPAVAAAREFAGHYGIDWALERALSAAESLLTFNLWGARLQAPEPFGLARVHQSHRTGYLRHVAVISELGLPTGARYFASRVDPNRFRLSTGGFDWRALSRWWFGAALGLTRTPWLGWVVGPTGIATFTRSEAE